MSREKILVVEDDEDILELIDYNLAKEGYQVLKATSGEEALSVEEKARPDLVMLDIMLPELDGLEICRRLRSRPERQDVPIIMVTAKGDESDIVTGLELGADDYVVKPFSPKVLIARVGRALRRARDESKTTEGAPIQIRGIYIQPERLKVRAGQEPVSLTLTEFNILLFLAQRPGLVFTRKQIVDAVKGDDYHVTDRAVDVHILGLRRKLVGHGDAIETVRGVGYRFKE